MNYREQVANEVTQAKENGSSNNDGGQRESVEQIEVDMGSTPFVKFYPTTALTGSIPADEGNPIIRFRDEQNNGHGEQGYLGIVVDDLTIDQSEDGGFDMTEAFIVETDDDDYTEYRAVNFGDEATSEKFGGEAVNIDGDQYGIEDRHASLDERAILVVDRTAAVSVAKKLDRDGATAAGMDEETGQPNTGLIEYAPDGEGQVDDFDGTISWRYARRPEMRDELLGTDVTFLVSRREEIDSGPTGYLGRDGDTNGGEPVLGLGEDEETHTNENEASYEELVAADEARGMMWYSVFDEDGEALEPVEGDAVGYSFLEWNFDPTAGYLPDDEYEFVVTYEAEGLPTDEETILDNVRENFDDANETRIVELIQNDNDHELQA
jgi:hypothetical protein